MIRARRVLLFLGMGLLVRQDARAATVSGGFEGSNVVDVKEIAPNKFTCKLLTPPMTVPTSTRYNTPGNHYHNWFMLKIENSAGKPTTVTITNADWGGGGDGMWGRADGKAVYTEASDPNSLAAENTWQKVTTASYSSPNFRLTLTPTTNLAWVALHYPALPSHTSNWVAQQSASPHVAAERIATTRRGRPLWMLFVSDSSFPLAAKKGVVIYGQEHMNEQNGGWTCQGAVEFLTSGDPVAQTLLRNVVFIIIPDLDPDATAAGTNCNPDDGKTPQWRYNPAAIDRMMPGMIAPMTPESKAIWNRLVRFVDDGGRVDFCFNIHQGGMDNWWGCYELADPKSINLDGFLRARMPTSGAPWVPNARQGYSRGGWQNYAPTGPFAFRLLGRCWEEWRTVPMGYEFSLGASSTNFITQVRGIKYFGEAIARSVHDYFGGFGKGVTVTAPNGGESLPTGGAAMVTWSSSGPIANVRIDCSTNGGASWTNLAASTPNDGSQSVTLPGANSDSCLIRVSDAAALGVSDLSDSPFTIGTPPSGSLTVTSPNGGETWGANWMDTVTWTSTGAIPNVKIELSADNGVTWRRLAYSVANSGSYRINVPNALSTRCRVRVTGVENSAIGDASDSTFAIGAELPWPALAVFSPNGGETWTLGGTARVTWSTTGSVATVGISLSTDEGASWTPLVAGTPNDGSETVAVPKTESSKCLIWIFDARNDPWLKKPDGDPWDASDGFFRIGNPTRAEQWRTWR